MGYSCTTLRVKNSLEITPSRTVFEIFTLFHFPPKSKMATISGENWHGILLYYPVGQKFARNCCISYGLRYSHFFIFSQNPRWPPKVAKIENFPLGIKYSCTTLWVKNSLKIALSLMVFEIFTLFHFLLKSKMAAESGENRNFSPLHRILVYYPVGHLLIMVIIKN